MMSICIYIHSLFEIEKAHNVNRYFTSTPQLSEYEMDVTCKFDPVYVCEPPTPLLSSSKKRDQLPSWYWSTISSPARAVGAWIESCLSRVKNHKRKHGANSGEIKERCPVCPNLRLPKNPCLSSFLSKVQYECGHIMYEKRTA
jgi:hypothetical protein